MGNIDLKKVYKEHYSRLSGRAVVVDVTPRRFLMIDGSGEIPTRHRNMQTLRAGFRQSPRANVFVAGD
ncbi:MAG TPA: hypothetical protein VF148_13425 [Acidimicrobiia bacterium]